MDSLEGAIRLDVSLSLFLVSVQTGCLQSRRPGYVQRLKRHEIDERSLSKDWDTYTSVRSKWAQSQAPRSNFEGSANLALRSEIDESADRLVHRLPEYSEQKI